MLFGSSLGPVSLSARLFTSENISEISEANCQQIIQGIYYLRTNSNIRAGTAVVKRGPEHYVGRR